MPITRFPFSNGCCRYRVAIRSLLRSSGSIRSGIKSGTILVSRNLPWKRSREREQTLSAWLSYPKLLGNEQREVQRQFIQIVRRTEHFRAAEAAGKLIRLPVGDGMALGGSSFIHGPFVIILTA